ncbi:MAG: glutathione peroxidase [Gammaproteobacteria bacterium]|nr:glutathione peroxidase [Gammaproteobacteria bacterium]MDH5802356.1 glutathione peroxidase [Gammaproteobacteria bacterium]
MMAAQSFAANQCPQTLQFQKRVLAGETVVDLCRQYAGKVLVVVNTASKCGFTPQYEGLENLYRRYRDQGLVVLGFPSNDFGGQEPGGEKKIQEFCRLTYGVEFPMFEKTHVAKNNADPLYQTLGRIAGEFPQWNFHKYILDRKGRLVASFNSRVTPLSSTMTETIEKLLREKP